ncbi:hypothetical protein ABGN35_004665, partial [Yersinia enterocolitica]
MVTTFHRSAVLLFWISFLRSDTGKPINGNNKGSLLFIWRPFIKPRCIFTTVKRDEL